MMPRDAATPPPGEEDGGSVRGWPRRLLAAGLLLVLGLVATELFVAAYAENQRQRLREQTVLHVAAMRAQMESALDSTAFLAQGLVAYIKSVHTIDRGHVDAALRALVQADRRIRNIGLAPDNVLSYIYPLRGNEAALGLDYRKVPSQWPSVERAIRQRSALLAGPVNLVQGGRGVICRTPVFLDDGRYWGMISVVIDLDLLLSDIQLRDTVDGLRYFLRGDNAGAAQASDLIVGSPEVLRDDPVSMPLTVPGGHWTLAAVPVAGWAVPRWETIALRVAGAILSLVLAASCWLLLWGRAVARLHNARLAALNRQLNAANLQLAEVTRKDELTGVANRRGFDEIYARDWTHCRRQQAPLSVLMIDIDYFKQINDRHGHAVGDACLVEVARRLTGAVRRAGDLLARYGGEEFVVLSPQLDHAGALELGERLRAAVNVPCTVVHGGESLHVPISVSVGVATAIPMGMNGPDDLLGAADSALYRAKRGGRNQVASTPRLAPSDKVVEMPPRLQK